MVFMEFFQHLVQVVRLTFYSLDIVPCDFCFISEIKNYIERILFSELTSDIQNVEVTYDSKRNRLVRFSPMKKLMG